MAADPIGAAPATGLAIGAACGATRAAGATDGRFAAPGELRSLPFCGGLEFKRWFPLSATLGRFAKKH
jgi:hypothetical protein